MALTQVTPDVLHNIQSNVTQVGTLSNLTVSGNATVGNLSATNLTGTLLTAAQTNVTSLGNLSSLSASGTIQTTGIVYGNATTPSTSSSTGALQTRGGLGVSGNINAGGNLSVTGNITAGNIALSGNITQNTVAGGIIPRGGIIMWSGSIVSIPTGWALCNGSNGTPDLRDRFIVGAGSTYSVAGTGGSANATLVSHSHSASSSFSGNPLAGHSHTATVTDPGHFHEYGLDGNDAGGTTVGDGADGQTAVKQTTTNTTGISVSLNSQSAGTPSGSVSTSISTEGSSATNANLPPYYALAFIMKL